MKRIEAGLYETEDGRYQVERVTALDEYEAAETLWVLNERRHGVWEEIGEATTKRELVARTKPAAGSVGAGEDGTVTP